MSTPTTDPIRRRRAVPVVLAVFTGLAALVMAAPTVAAEDGIAVEAFVDDEPLADSSSNDPIVLEPDTAAVLRVDVTNGGPDALPLTRVRLEGRALGLVFVAYDASVDVSAPADQVTTLTIPLRFYDLDDQATGLLPATLIVYGADGEAVAEQDFTIDVRGRLSSIVGVFSLVVIGLTTLGVVVLARQVATRQLPENRWHRALQFAPVGLGVGLIATIALAVLRIAAPYGMVWFPLLVVPTAIAFGLGYVAPGPTPHDDLDEITDTVEPDAPDQQQSDPHVADAEAAAGDPRATRPSEAPDPLAGSTR